MWRPFEFYTILYALPQYLEMAISLRQQIWPTVGGLDEKPLGWNSVAMVKVYSCSTIRR